CMLAVIWIRSTLHFVIGRGAHRRGGIKMATENTAAQKQPPRTTAEIENDLAAVRSRLAANVASLVDEIHPQRFKERQIESLRNWAEDEAQGFKHQFVTPDGGVRTARVAAIAAAALGVVGFVLVVRAIGRRNK